MKKIFKKAKPIIYIAGSVMLIAGLALKNPFLAGSPIVGFYAVFLIKNRNS